MTVSTKELEAFGQYGRTAELKVALEENLFVKTEIYYEFRHRVFGVVEDREAHLKAGRKEQKGVALIGPAGSGKSRIAEEVINEYHALAEASGGREFGCRIISVIVPGRATVRETLVAILKTLGYEATGGIREEDTLANTVMKQLKEHRVAAIHLDEVQDSGRFKTSDSVEAFAKRFRNFTQDKEWPVCLLMTATLEGKAMINHDPTLTRRLRLIEIKPITFKESGQQLRSTVKQLLADAKINDADSLVDEDEFIKILIHAAVGRFGIAVEMAIEAIGECVDDGRDEIEMGYFADAYALRNDCDEELNPFVSESWSTIDTGKAMQRYQAETQQRRRRVKTT